jgi:hypothetical protein
MEQLGQFTQSLWLLTVIAPTGILALLLGYGAPRRFPALFVYVTLMPRVNWQLRVLNQELIRLWCREAPGT